MKEIKNIVIAVVVVLAFITASNVFQGVFEPIKCFVTTCADELKQENEKLKAEIKQLAETNKENTLICIKEKENLRDNIDSVKKLVAEQCALDIDKENILSDLDYIVSSAPKPILAKSSTEVVKKEKVDVLPRTVVKSSEVVKPVKSHAETDIDAVWAMYNRTTFK